MGCAVVKGKPIKVEKPIETMFIGSKVKFPVGISLDSQVSPSLWVSVPFSLVKEGWGSSGRFYFLVGSHSYVMIFLVSLIYPLVRLNL